MEFWLGWFHEDNDHIKQVATAAEALGFTGIALADHVAIPLHYKDAHPSGKRDIFHDTSFPDCLVSIATMAAVTTTLRFMTYIYVLPMREPFSVAKQIATLAMQTDYRFSFGVGAGWNTEEIALLGHDPATRGRRMDDMISVIRDLLDDGVARSETGTYRFETVGQFPVPRQKVPIMVGGDSNQAIQRAARNDGWLGMSYSIDQTRNILEKLQRERIPHDNSKPYTRMVIYEGKHSHEVFAQLEAMGIDGVVILPANIERHSSTSFNEKIDMLANFSSRYIRV